jgi:hypothetical protein
MIEPMACGTFRLFPLFRWHGLLTNEGIFGNDQGHSRIQHGPNEEPRSLAPLPRSI